MAWLRFAMLPSVIALAGACTANSGDDGIGGSSSGGATSSGGSKSSGGAGGLGVGGKNSGGSSSGGVSSGGTSSGGTSSGGASSGGFGGTSASGGTGGGGEDACYACMDSQCAAELAACDANPECVAMGQCYDQCTTDDCYQKCYEAHPTAQALDDAIFNCIMSKCATPCQ